MSRGCRQESQALESVGQPGLVAKTANQCQSFVQVGFSYGELTLCDFNHS